MASIVDFDILSKCFNFGGKYHISGKFLGVSGKLFSSLGKIRVCPEKCFDSQNGSLTENFFGDGGGVGGEVWSPSVAEKGSRHKICLRDRPSKLLISTDKIRAVVRSNFFWLATPCHESPQRVQERIRVQTICDFRYALPALPVR